jgi:organic hydroperoxide reductase OsmC/OhrA
MMGTLASVLASKKIPTHTDRFRCETEGDIENVDGTLKITTMRVRHILKATPEQEADAQWAFERYLQGCPAAQSVIGCIDIQHELILESG